MIVVQKGEIEAKDKVSLIYNYLKCMIMKELQIFHGKYILQTRCRYYIDRQQNNAFWHLLSNTIASVLLIILARAYAIPFSVKEDLFILFLK